MKTEDIDKRIGMPDVDKEWARFEQEVISGGTKRHSALAWALGIGIAASVALLIIYNIGKEQTEEPLVAQVQPARPEHVSELARVPAKEVVAEVSKPVATPRKELALTKADASATTGLDIPAREYTGAVQKFKMDDIEDLAFESVDQALQGQIAERDIASADLGSGTTMHLRGIGDSIIDQIGKTDSFLVVVNGKTLFDSRGMASEEIDRRIEEYLKEQGLLQDIKIPCNNGAIVIMASTPEEREELQRMIANATIVPTSADLGSGTTMRLRGTGDGPSDKDRIDSTLILVNGEPLPDSLKQRIMGNDMDDIDTYMPRYFSQQGLMIDSVYVHKDSYYTEKYGGRAKYGVIEITTVPDTYSDAYVCKHPKLKKKYHRVEGYMFDNNGKPLTEAYVHVERDFFIGAATDSTGHFRLQVLQVLPFGHEPCHTSREELQHAASRQSRANARMTPFSTSSTDCLNQRKTTSG